MVSSVEMGKEVCSWKIRLCAESFYGDWNIRAIKTDEPVSV